MTGGYEFYDDRLTDELSIRKEGRGAYTCAMRCKNEVLNRSRPLTIRMRDVIQCMEHMNHFSAVTLNCRF